jgi:flavin-dependent dehydrogenase
VKKPITIAGGGLAGLALGLALRQREIPVTIVEAANYPRHRVCGEFISGIDPDELRQLGIDGLMQPARQHTSTMWCEDDRAWFRASLPTPAYGLSRHYLDDAMARRFVELGGELRVGTRVESDSEGTVWASGRKRGAGGWLGLKSHYDDLELSADLEIHLQDGGYVGLTRVEDGRVNVCGLFRGGRTAGADALPAACDNAGLPKLGARLRRARTVPGSLKGVTHFHLGWQSSESTRICIGDAAAMIPPFTGNGMTMALQSGLAAADDLAAWSEGSINWAQAGRRIRAEHRRRFSRRLRWALFLQAVMLRRATRRFGLGLLASRLAPFETLYTKVR